MKRKTTGCNGCDEMLGLAFRARDKSAILDHLMAEAKQLEKENQQAKLELAWLQGRDAGARYAATGEDPPNPYKR